MPGLPPSPVLHDSSVLLHPFPPNGTNTPFLLLPPGAVQPNIGYSRWISVCPSPYTGSFGALKCKRTYSLGAVLRWSFKSLTKIESENVQTKQKNPLFSLIYHDRDQRKTAFKQRTQTLLSHIFKNKLKENKAVEMLRAQTKSSRCTTIPLCTTLKTGIN